MENLSDAFYAYPARRQFPMFGPDQTKSSYGAYSVQRNKYSEDERKLIEGNFEKAASFYEIELKPEEKKPADRPLLAFKGQGDTGISMTEITTLEELDKAANYIIEKRSELPRAVLAEPAKYVLWSASNTDVDMTTDKMRKIARIAGIGVGDRDKIEHELKRRSIECALGSKESEDFWKFARSMDELTDEEFYTEENLNKMCTVMDEMDIMYGNQHKQASDLGYPEDVVFEQGLDDMISEVSDYYTVGSIDTTLSKKATLERADQINAFFKRHFAMEEPLEGEKLIEKVASLDAYTANALIKAIE